MENHWPKDGDSGSSGPKEQREPEFVGYNEADDETLDRIYRKLDIRIIPPLWTLYFLCSAIRSNVGLAQTMNLKEKHDLGHVLHLTPRQVSTSLALFYVCYIIFDLPSNLIMTRLSPHVWMSRIVISVGVIGALMAAVKAAWSLYLLRLLLGIVIAGMWPGMAYYLSLFYPPARTGQRIGFYFTAAQVSAAVVGLVSAGFQKMDGLQGLVGFQWMFLIWGLVGTLMGITLLWWLPDRPVPPGESHPPRSAWLRWIPNTTPALSGRDEELHYADVQRVYKKVQWGWSDVLRILCDWRLWPVTIMYFGVVGVGIGVQSYGTVIIRAAIPSLTGVQLSLLFAPIWVMDLIAILIMTPISDAFHHHRPAIFIFSCLILLTGLLLTTFTRTWTAYGGLLIVGFGLGPTVPITMSLTAELFGARYGDVGVAASTAIVSGLGNLGSIVSTYALYTGWEGDVKRGYRGSNGVMCGIVGGSILAAVVVGMIVWGKQKEEQRGWRGVWWAKWLIR
ncbi:High affinity nicotinic acid plasma membrane permease [Trichophyton interdigitale]|uniref:High affinity nicotinic acid plasma membrane permease n=1 Tax=Trichophyton interdigitale TaxID=101480 RepID=A0A9P4YES0_9EURO|nr:High affinity nicotinic acid plasma membrane permease [Trichophyton interdigitale]KAF3893709.1 High affinity nicotinic acid plasma membrane permease [Trichophyton interdigitale]KAG8208182.1 High affinity nicotinic acid plasma membrane permease [Trichophyton interdigitale]